MLYYTSFTVMYDVQYRVLSLCFSSSPGRSVSSAIGQRGRAVAPEQQRPLQASAPGQCFTSKKSLCHTVRPLHLFCAFVYLK